MEMHITADWRGPLRIMYTSNSLRTDNDNLPLPCPLVVTFDRIPTGNRLHATLHFLGDLQTRHRGVLLVPCSTLHRAEHTPLRMVLVHEENDFIS